MTNVRHRFGLLLALLLLATAAWAQPDPQQLVKQVTNQTLARLAKEQAALKADPRKIYPLVEDLVLPHFDFSRMSAWVLGRYWRTATPAQRTEFTRQFRTLLVRTYAVALLQYSGQTINYMPTRMSASGRTALVRTTIKQPGQAPIALDYALYRHGDQWLVYDITVEGVSLVTNYRSSFASEIATNGLDSLIGQLEKRNAAKTGASS